MGVPLFLCPVAIRESRGRIIFGPRPSGTSICPFPFRFVPTGGKVPTDGSGIIVDSADELLVLLAAETDYDAYSSTYTSNTNGLASTICNRLEAVANKGWEAIYADHLADYKPYFDRVVLDLQGSANSYDATYCDLTLEKLTAGGHVAAKSNAELFGLMTLKGMRYSRNSYSYFAISPNGAFDGANEPYFDNSYSSAILIELVNAQPADFVIGSGDEEEEDDDFEEESWEESTGIETVEKATKAETPVYDLMGRRVTVLVKGKIYIKNGKKFIAK